MNQAVVFHVPVSETDTVQQIQNQFSRMLDSSGLFQDVLPGFKPVIKMHFGEEGNTGFVDPSFVRVLCQDLIKRGSSPVLADTNTLYRGRRVFSDEHRKLAYEHGFTPENTGARVEIPDERRQEEVVIVSVNEKQVKEAKLLRLFTGSEMLVSLAHFKGHIMSGFGGTLKNLGMGCATREGKLFQHGDVAPVVESAACIACGACVNVCPADAVSMVNGKARVDEGKCIGCASCIAACAYEAMSVNWGKGGATLQPRMVEYAAAVVRSVRSFACINFATKITAECDCLAKDDPRIVPDIGIFAGRDPVAVDQACYDSVIQKAGKDVFKEAHSYCDPAVQLAYAEKLKIGTRKYKLQVL
ncbi:MAG: DUF362 domain-containing protein [Candidatus Aureabacteria bacterium]|nr:DUF362 domain-containing protein [Candidatus Auribacterota bacterium]